MKNNNDFREENEKNYNGLYLYIAAFACVLSAVFFGLIFSPLGVYSLIVATLFSLVALNFIARHKKYKNDNLCKIVNIASYVLFGLCLLTFVCGMIAAATQG